MPISRIVEGDLIRTTMSGYITFDEIQHHIQEAQRTRTFGCAEIIDGRGAIAVSLSFNEMMRAALLVRDSLGNDIAGRRAFIVDSEVNRRLARIFALLVSRWMRVAVFDDADDAARWLQESGTAVAPLDASQPLASH